jgi:hypothetical protein
VRAQTVLDGGSPARSPWIMINHTLFIAFDEPVSGDDLARTLADIDAAIAGTGLARSFAARPHQPIDGEAAIPAFIGSAIIQIGLPDVAALESLFAAQAVTATFEAIRERHPYRTAWVNHEPLA